MLDPPRPDAAESSVLASTLTNDSRVKDWNILTRGIDPGASLSLNVFMAERDRASGSGFVFYVQGRR